jgi:hypothetical protein
MSVPRFFWLSSSVALLVFAASASYVLLAYIPARDRHRDQQAADAAERLLVAKEEDDCPNQAARTTKRFYDEYSNYSPLGLPTNHYSRRLHKCLVHIKAQSNLGLVDFLLDAYESTQMQVCVFPTYIGAHGTCTDSDGKAVSPDDADMKLKNFMAE